MKKGMLRRGFAVVLSVAMLLTGISYPHVTVKADDSGVVQNAGINVTKVEGLADDFIRGVDISTYKSLIDSGVTFRGWDGRALDEPGFFRLLKDAGVNYVRIRVWNDPYADEAKTQGYGAGNCDVKKAALMGKWATDAGMKVMVDFHYSDFWADPGRQVVPKAWKGFTVAQKAEALSEFTEESLNTILDAGADVGMVQVGNETTSSICGESNWDNMVTLFKAGCDAVHKVAGDRNKEILAALHFTNPERNDRMKGFADKLNTAAVDYDVFASSYYPYWHGTRENLTSVLKYVADKYQKKVMVAETSWARTMEDGDGQPNVVREGQNDDTTQYAATPQGQANEVRDVIEAVANVGEAGIGVMYWEPAWLPVNVYHADAEDAAEVLEKNRQAWDEFGSGWASSYSIPYDPNVTEKNYGGSEWDNQAMFDFEGNPLPSLNVYKYVFTGAVNPKRLDAVENPCVEVELGDDIAAALPATVNGSYNDGDTAENLPVTWNQEEIKRISSFGTFRINGIVTYQTQEGTTETINAVCTVNVLPKNLLQQGDFESGRDKWTIEGTGINSKTTENPRRGENCVAFYLAKDYELTVTQSVTVEEAGTYRMFLYLQGGNEDEVTARIQLSNDTEKTSEQAEASVKGWLVWQNPMTNKVSAKQGDVLTVTITITGKAASWGSIDDVYLYQDIEVGSITLSPVAKVLERNQTFALNAQVAPENATKKTLKWESSDERVAKVDEHGVVTTIGPGQATITASATDGSAAKGSCMVTVPYKIAYNLNGGSISSGNPDSYYNQNLNLKNPTRKNYIFQGWYADSGFMQKIDSITPANNSDLTLYAKWSKVSVARASVKSVKNSAKKKVKVTIKKVTGAKGYRIQYSTNRKFKKGVKTKATTKTSYTLNGLKKGKTYYVRVCAYKLDSQNNKVYGKYGTVKKIKIKK